jgi:hypothetical protein
MARLSFLRRLLAASLFAASAHPLEPHSRQRPFSAVTPDSMKILGIQLRKPSFNEVTASAVMAAGLWLAYVALMKVSGQGFDRVQAGAVLLVIFWGCVCVRFGIHVGRGVQHLALNVAFGGALLILYQGAVSLFA